MLAHCGRLGLRGKLLLIFMLTLLIPSALVLYYITAISTEKMLKKTTQLAYEASQKDYEAFESVLSQMQDLCMNIGYYDPLLKKYLNPSVNYTDVLSSIDAYSNYLNRYIYVDSGKPYRVKIIYTNETLIQNYAPFLYATEALKTSPVYTDAIERGGLPTWGVSVEGGERTLFASRAMLRADGVVIGVVAAYLPVSAAREMLNSSFGNLVGDIIDRRGYSILDPSAQPVFADDLARFVSYEVQPSVMIHQGRDSLRFRQEFSPALSLEWSYLSVMPIHSITEEAVALRNEGLVITLCGYALAVLLFYLLLSRVAGVLSELVSYMERVGNGDYSPMREKRGRDELAILAQSFNRMALQLSSLIHENYEAGIRIRDIALNEQKMAFYALQSQINPHFLFNTLESIRMKILVNKPNAADAMLLALSRMLRESANFDSMTTTLNQELALAEDYLRIQKLRFPDRLSFVIDAAFGLEIGEIALPKLIVQPLVENAVTHGIEPKLSPGRVEINVRDAKGVLCIRVYDDGVGIDAERLSAIQKNLNGEAENARARKGIGLKNIYDRLMLYYGGHCQFTVRSDEHSGTEVLISFDICKKSI